MNLALIIAGGTGCRMHNSIPKQFKKVSGIPVILYTLSIFQNNPNIDVICVSCLRGWEKWLANSAQKYGISKLKHITTGGATGFESIFNGLKELKKHYSSDSIVLIHDAVRPIVPDTIINNCIKAVTKYGNAITAIPCYEAIMVSADGISSTTAIPHNNLICTQAPQGFKLKDIFNAHIEARSKGIKNAATSSTLMTELGKKVYIVQGSRKNIKLTTPDDFEILKALLKIQK